MCPVATGGGADGTAAASSPVSVPAHGGHSLAMVCERELGLLLDNCEQTSDWTRRPLSAAQLAYAALDVEVLLELRRVFAAQMLV